MLVTLSRYYYPPTGLTTIFPIHLKAPGVPLSIQLKLDMRYTLYKHHPIPIPRLSTALLDIVPFKNWIAPFLSFLEVMSSNTIKSQRYYQIMNVFSTMIGIGDRRNGSSGECMMMLVWMVWMLTLQVTLLVTLLLC